ncbi:unnamed protein product, partial [Hymenolepis diminuta]
QKEDTVSLLEIDCERDHGFTVKDNSLCIFQNFLLFAFSTIIPQFFPPRSLSDLIYVPITHNPCLSDMSKRVQRFPLFTITASLHKKGTSALMLWRDLTQVTHIKLPLFFQTTRTGQCGLLHVLFISSLPQHAALP